MKKKKILFINNDNKSNRTNSIGAFTLIELLAIIVILAIIAVITVPIILNIIEKSRKGAATASAHGYKDGINKYYVERVSYDPSYNMTDGEYTVDPENGYLAGTSETLEIKISGQKPSSGTVELEKNIVKQACITFGNYSFTIENGKVSEAKKATCNGTSISLPENGSETKEDTEPVQSASETITRKAISEEQLTDYTATTLKDPVIINHSAVTSNKATEDPIPELTSYTYMGANPDNYIYFNCDSYNKDEQDKTHCEIWRIISVENGKLKITPDNIITYGPWDEGKVQHNNRALNDWATSDLNDFLNGKYLNGNTTVSSYNNFTPNSSFTTGKAHGLINSATVSLIETSTWYLGGGASPDIYSSDAYEMERKNTRYTSDGKTRATFIKAKVAIISPSDYGYASSKCYSGTTAQKLSAYDACASSNWMKISQNVWLLTHTSNTPNDAWFIDYDGFVYNTDLRSVFDGAGVRPTLYLIPQIGLSGTGTLEEPYKIVKLS